VAPDPVQTPAAAPAPGIEVSTEGNVTTYTTPGNLQSNFDIGCIDVEQVKNVYTPADLFKGATACFRAGENDKAVNLYWIGAAYGRFDIGRVADRTAHQGLDVLQSTNFEASTADGGKLIYEYIVAFHDDPEEWAGLCTKLRALGPPAYHPDYMIQHGMAAFQPWAAEGVNGLLADFDADAMWENVLAACTPGTDPVAAAPADQDAQEVAPTDADAAQAQLDSLAASRVREAPMLAAAAKMAVAEYYRAEGSWPESNAQLGVDEPTPQVPITIGKAGVITIRFDEPAVLGGKSIVLTPRAEASGDWVNVLWDCTPVDIPAALRATNCP
jgi:hypothetical protein